MQFEPQSLRQAVDEEWVAFPGGELEGRRPEAVCEACRDRKTRFRFRSVVRPTRSHTLCFQCYRAELDRRRADMRLPAPLVRRAHASTMAFPERDQDPKYTALRLRRCRAQIAARHALADADAKYPVVREPLVAVSP